MQTSDVGTGQAYAPSNPRPAHPGGWTGPGPTAGTTVWAWGLHRLAVLIPVAVVASTVRGRLGLASVLIAFLALTLCDSPQGGYWGRRVSGVVQLWAGSIVCVILAVAAIGAVHAIPPISVDSGNVAEVCLAIAAGVLLERAARRAEHRGPIVVAASEREADELRRDLVLVRSNPFASARFLTAEDEGGVSGVMRAVDVHKPELLVVGDEADRAGIIRELLDGGHRNLRIVSLHQFYEYAFGRVPVENLSPIWFMSVIHVYRRAYSRATKRGFDLFVGGLALILSIPIMVVLALLVRRSGPGPVLYRQTRLGEGGVTYQVLKLRTMVDGAEDDTGAAWAADDDPRVTLVGRFLRDTRLDELPQFWNVVKGEMSLVGPRPERPEFLERLRQEVPFWTTRQLVKPGITGWAQLNIGYTSDAGGAAEKLSYDLYYLRHRSLWMDIVIAAATAQFMVSGACSPRPIQEPRAEPAAAVSNVDATAG